MRNWLVILIAIVSSAVMAQGYPPRGFEPQTLDPEDEKARLGLPNGDWAGFVQPMYNPKGLNNDQLDRYEIRLTIRERSAQIATVEGDGHLYQFDGEIYIYNVDNTVLLNYVNWNGAFVEYQSIALAQIEPDVMKGYLSRVVHTIIVPNTSPERLMPMYGEVELKRVR